VNRRDALTALGATAAGLAPARAAHDAKPAATPVGNFHAYLCAFHTAKADPKVVIESHHYCGPLGSDLHQCCVFDGSGPGAKLIGVEYIVPDEVYQKLPDAEKKYWHPHRYEVTSGLLVAPAMSPADEDKLMAGLITTWGKTWHTWPDPTTALPVGEPLLMWAATGDGQVPAEVLAARDKRNGIDTPAVRKRRAKLGAVPQVPPPKSIDEVGRQQ
jgi:hypothetical protein